MVNLSALHKKLQTSWSSWTTTASLSNANYIDQISANFANLEKKVKMRVMISLAGIPQSKKSLCMNSIKKLLRIASEDTTDQVSVMKGK